MCPCHYEFLKDETEGVEGSDPSWDGSMSLDATLRHHRGSRLAICASWQKRRGVWSRPHLVIASPFASVKFISASTTHGHSLNYPTSQTSLDVTQKVTLSMHSQRISFELSNDWIHAEGASLSRCAEDRTGSLSSACKKKSLLILCLVVRGIWKIFVGTRWYLSSVSNVPPSSATGISVDAFKVIASCTELSFPTIWF